MSKQATLLTMFTICLLLILSYNYVVDETQAAATADPIHSGKALLATLMPYLWLMFIILALIVALLEIMGQIS